MRGVPSVLSGRNHEDGFSSTIRRRQKAPSSVGVIWPIKDVGTRKADSARSSMVGEAGMKSLGDTSIRMIAGVAVKRLKAGRKVDLVVITIE